MPSDVQTTISSDSCVDPEVLEHFQSLLPSEEEENWLTQTGVLMADPGCKGVLTLHNLVAEEEAALKQVLGRDVTIADLKESNPIRLPWRHFSCAGDDHQAIGPNSYLDQIGTNHTRNQMVVSVGKHFPAENGGYYCERLSLRLPETKLVSKERLDYSQHVLVDSIKVRLLSPEMKDREKESETNPSIGKARQLFKTLDWAPPGWKRTLGVVCTRRFFGRMHKYLPKDEATGKPIRQIELPIALGGLGMCPPSFERWDVDNILAELTPNHMRLLQHVLKGKSIDALGRRALGKYSSDRFARGVRMDDGVDIIIDTLFELLPTTSEEDAVAAARKRYKLRENLGYRHTMAAVKKLGYETKFTLKGKLARASVQAELLGSSPERGFKTATWSERKLAYQVDISIACVTNEVDEKYDMAFIYDAITSSGNSDRLTRKIRSTERYLDPTYEVEYEQGPRSILKDLKEYTPGTQVPPLNGFV